MPGRSTPAPIREYVAVLRGIGLTESAIADAHGGRDDPNEPLEAFLESELPGTSDPELHEALADAISGSARGIDAPAEYWNHAPEVHLDELLSPYGCAVTIEPTKRADTLAEGKFIIRLTDAHGTEFWTRFEYPESDLGEDNYPALVHHVEEQLLAVAGLRLVRLVSPRRRWRFAMMTDAQLSALRNRYGEHLEIFGAPLLAEHQPVAFATKHPPVPEWYEPTKEPISADGDVTIDVPRAQSLDELEPTEAELSFEVGGDSPDAIVEAVHEPGGGSGETAAVSGGDGVEASDDQLESVFGDLSDVSLEPDEPEPEPASPPAGETLAIDGGATAATDADDPMDDLFDELKRDIADSEPTTGEEADAGMEASVADLVDGVQDDSPPATEDGEDVPHDAADLTASELFSGLNDDG